MKSPRFTDRLRGQSTHTPYAPPPILPLTPEQYKHLEECWWIAKGYILGHDGTSREGMNITTNVKDDPLLQTALLKIRDGYFELFNQTRQYEVAENRFDLITHPAKHRKLKELRKTVEAAIEEHNYTSFERLQEKDYGFTAEEKAQLGLPAENRPGLPGPDAHKLMHKIVPESINAFEAAFTPHRRMTVTGGLRRPQAEPLQTSPSRTR